MAEIRHVQIWGAGAMGSLYAWKFFQAEGMSVSLIAGGERARRLSAEGLCVNGNRFRPEVVDLAGDSEASELIVVALKHHHLVGAVDEVAAAVGPDTLFLSVMNGIDSEAILGGRYGPEKVLPAVALGMDALREKGNVVFTRAGRILFGPPAGRENPSSAVGRVQRAFDRADIDWEVPSDIHRALWWKLMINVGVNQTSAVLRAPFGVFHTCPAARTLMVSAMQEVIAVARRKGIDLSDEDIGEWLSVLSGLSPEGKTSMLQDVEAGRKTEVEIFAGRIVSEGRRCGVPTPVNETLLQILQVYEQRRGGEVLIPCPIDT
ncbi:MAG: ketopantoate reductase family protein [Desulfobacteraceae bacterium]|nr:ketopantoate reductase family protein [Desulfobacteraceae bacterium]